MRMPLAVREFGRSFDQGNYLGFLLGARRLLQAAGSLGAIEESMKVMEGWAQLADDSVEEDRKEATDEEATLLFSRERTAKALEAVTRAVDALGDGSPFKLEGVLDSEESGPALSHLEGVKGFLAEFPRYLGILDAIRIPAWQARWTGKRGASAPIDLSVLKPPLSPTDSQLSAPGPDTQRLTVTRPGQPVWSLEVDAKGLTGKQVQVTELGQEGNEEDREILLYDWVDEQVKPILPRPMGGMAMVCSFCGKNNREVQKLIAGPNSYICNECVQLCSDIIAESSSASSGE